MNKVKKVGFGFASLLGVFSPLLAHAQLNYESQLSTTTALVQDIGGDVLGTIYAVVGIVAGIIVFVWGVGYAFKKLGGKTGMKRF